MKTILIVLLTAAIAVPATWLVARKLSHHAPATSTGAAAGKSQRKLLYYQSAMHPWIKSDVTEEANVAEAGINPLAICHRRLGGVTILHVKLVRRRALMRFLAPQLAAGFKLITKDQPAMDRLGRFLSLAAEIETFLGRLHLSFADHCGQEQFVAPNDWRGPSPARHREFCGHGDVG